MKNSYKIGIGVIVLIILFTQIPTSNVSKDARERTVFRDKEAYKCVEEDDRDYYMCGGGSNPPFKHYSYDKSGLRIAIEGRFKWLGLPDPFGFVRICDKEKLECRYSLF